MSPVKLRSEISSRRLQMQQILPVIDLMLVMVVGWQCSSVTTYWSQSTYSTSSLVSTWMGD